MLAKLRRDFRVRGAQFGQVAENGRFSPAGAGLSHGGSGRRFGWSRKVFGVVLGTPLFRGRRASSRCDCRRVVVWGRRGPCAPCR